MTEIKRPRGRPPGQVPHNKGKSLPANRLPVRSYLRGIRQLSAIVESDDAPVREVVQRLGVCQNTWFNWKAGRRTPDLATFEGVAETLGYELVLRPLSKDT